MQRFARSLVTLTVMVVMLGALALPALATPPAQGTAAGPRIITGSYTTTNPIYPAIGAETGIVLYDLTGPVLRDYDYQPDESAQVLGTLEGDIVSGHYTITLPERPAGRALDFDRDATTPPAVQVFAPATFIEFLGDPYMNRGETPLDLSARFEPLSYDVIGGYVLVWAARDGEQFPAAFGPDGAAFTPDDPLMTLPAGWSVVSLETDPFTVIRDTSVDIPVVESFGGLNDYSDLDYVEAWNALYTRTAVTYPFTAEKSLDWDAIYAEITPLVERAITDLDFHLTVTRLGGLIPDTHIGYVSVQVMQNYLMGGIGIWGLTVTDDEQVVVTGVDSSSPAGQAGISAGDVLVTVDGEPALRVLDETPLLLTSASTRHGRRYMQASMMLQGPIGSQVALTWRKPDGTQHSASFLRTMDVGAILAAFGASLSGDLIESRILESGVGYIRVRSFAEDVSHAEDCFARELQALIDAGVPGIILDVRDNSGGLVQLAMAMAGHFFPDYERLFDFYYADGEGGFAYRGFVEILVSDPYYDGPLAILVNEMTGSAGDLFVYALQREDRALVVGHTPTGGFAGEVGDGQYILPGGLNVQIPTGRPVDPVTGMALLEGTGVIPDIHVPRTLASILSPEDEVLIAAEAALSGR